MSAHSHKDYLFRLASLHLEAYIIKPLTSSKLSNLLEKFCKVSVPKNHSTQNICKGISYSYDTKTVKIGENIITLTNMEINLLELLLKNRGKIVTYPQIEFELYENRGMNKNMPKMFIRNLRKKIPNIPIISKINVGYILEY